MPALEVDAVSKTAPATRSMRRLVPIRSPQSPTTDSIETEDMLRLPEPEPERRGFERHDVWETNIAVEILAEESGPLARGRVRNMSINGMWVDTARPLPFRMPVHADWCLGGELTKRFIGRVVRSTPTGMAIQLETDDPTWRFRTRFFELATSGDSSQLSMTVHADPNLDLNRVTALKKSQEIRGLFEKWQAVERDLGNEELHQAFIHACLQAQRVEYALERYRELRMLQPGLPSIDRHLKQIGTILTFCTLKQDGSPEREAPFWKKPLVAAIAIVIFAAGTTFLAQRFAAMEQERAVVVEQLQSRD